MEPMVVEVRYQGIVVGRAARARELGAAGAFVEADAPMPVGSVLTLAPEGGPELRTRVTQVAEVGDGRGMAVCWAGLDEAARSFLTTACGTAPVDADAGAAPATGRADAGPPGVVAEEVAPADEVSAPIDVAGTPGDEGSKGKRGKRKKR
jgi:hypothetical protein